MLHEVSKLDTMVTVVDAANFLKDYQHADRLTTSRGESLGPDDTRTVADFVD